MVRITKSVTFSDDDIAKIVANNYSGSRIDSFLERVLMYMSTNVEEKNTLNSIEKFIKRHTELTRQIQKINNRVFCLTGDFDLGKRYWQRTITSKGGIVKSSVTNSVDYLVIDNGKMDGTSSIKQKEAKKLGIPIIHVSELKNFS